MRRVTVLPLPLTSAADATCDVSEDLPSGLDTEMRALESRDAHSSSSSSPAAPKQPQLCGLLRSCWIIVRTSSGEFGSNSSDETLETASSDASLQQSAWILTTSESPPKRATLTAFGDVLAAACVASLPLDRVLSTEARALRPAGTASRAEREALAPASCGEAGTSRGPPEVLPPAGCGAARAAAAATAEARSGARLGPETGGAGAALPTSSRTPASTGRPTAGRTSPSGTRSTF
mmetsp:Transcript_90598/g.283321  ORF Transcript_90598/g.283321 Transcript_90598/m.283321 type:complete len:235 (+) Transcript_90598:163-867(+)